MPKPISEQLQTLWAKHFDDMQRRAEAHLVEGDEFVCHECGDPHPCNREKGTKFCAFMCARCRLDPQDCVCTAPRSLICTEHSPCAACELEERELQNARAEALENDDG